MQSRFQKLFIILTILFTSNSLSAQKVDYFFLRDNADTLFKAQKYIQAGIKYDSVFYIGGKLSPAMLLKMAYIKEGLGDYTQALYFLNLYQLHFPDLRVLKKMSALAEKNQLKGYEYNDLEYFIALYHEFYYQIFYILIGLTTLFFIYNVIRLFIAKTYPKSRLYLLLFIIGIVYTFINFGIPSYKGIVVNDGCYLMDGPSAGAKYLGMLNKGHRINILNKEDVWYAVIWDDKTAFIKENNLALVSNRRTKEQFNLFSYMYDAVMRISKELQKLV